VTRETHHRVTCTLIGDDRKTNLLNCERLATEAFGHEANLVKEVFKWVLVGTLIMFLITTILSITGLAMILGEDEDILFFLRIVSLFASVVLTIALTVMREL
jgi:hypothetical protein